MNKELQEFMKQWRTINEIIKWHEERGIKTNRDKLREQFRNNNRLFNEQKTSFYVAGGRRGYVYTDCPETIYLSSIKFKRSEAFTLLKETNKTIKILKNLDTVGLIPPLDLRLDELLEKVNE